MRELLPERLKKLREDRGWTQQQLGEKINVSDATINRYEKGLRSPDPKTLDQLANIFNTSVDYLLGRTTYNNMQVTEGIVAPYPATGDPMDDLPPEAIKEIEEFREYVRHKYRKDKSTKNKPLS